MEEVKKEEIGYKKPPKDNPTKFKPWQSGGATNEQKAAWWERKRQAKIIMDKMLCYGHMSVAELKREIASKWENMSVQDYLITKYVLAGTKSEKMLVDRLDRHISKAPTQIEQNMSWWIVVTELTDQQRDAIASIQKSIE